MFRKLLIIALIVFTNATLASAKDRSWCNLPKKVDVRIIPSMAKIGYDYSKSFTDLSKVKLSSVNPYGSKAITHTFGLANGQFQIEQTAKLMTLTNPRSKETCMWYDTVDVKIKMSPVIMIAKEYKKGGCHFKEVMAHEQQHVAVDTQVVNEYAQKLGQQLMVAVSQKPIIGPFPTSDKATVQSEMQERLQSIVKANNTAMMADRDQRQAQIDSKENYDAISVKIHDVCDKKSPRTAKRVQRKL